jgi:NADH pyrophosphatase NudC (nudix superfamily)
MAAIPKSLSQHGAEHFPRTDPVVMLPVFRHEDGREECLVGRNKRFPPLLLPPLPAVEPGEAWRSGTPRIAEK